VIDIKKKIGAGSCLNAKLQSGPRLPQRSSLANERLEKLSQEETKQKQMTLCIRKSPSHPELYLEDT
jgi:hypothetical protein